MKPLTDQNINLLRQNARSVVRELGLLNEAYFEIGVTLAERHLLIELSSSKSPLTAKEIAERLLLDKSTVSRLVAKAEKKGFITCVLSQNDKRKRFLQLTDEGRKTLFAFEPIAFNQTKNALHTLTSAEISLVYQGVALYAEGLKTARLQMRESSKEVPSHSESLEELYKQLYIRGYTLETYTSEDEDELFTIFKEVVATGCQFPYESSSKKEFQTHFFAPNTKVYVCKSLQGLVIGGFYLRANATGRASHIANAAYMLHSNYQGQGLGSLLVKASLHLAKNLEFQAMQFNMVLSQNTRAVTLYQKLGFTIIGVIPDAIRSADQDYQNAYIMHRKLDHL